MKTKRNPSFFWGIAAVVAYVLHVVLGGLLWPGYNHLAQPISDLTATSSPGRSVAAPLANLYGVLSIAFAGSLLVETWARKNRLLTVGLGLLLLLFTVSFLYGFFPEDLPNEPPTVAGLMHIVVTIAIVPFTIATPIVVGIASRKDHRRFSLGSVVVGGLIFVFGGLTGLAMAVHSDLFGLAERINIGTLMVWIVAVSSVLGRKDSSPQV
jgi:hypothetical membrane protein